MRSANRLAWIDFVRATCIWLVVLGHFLPSCWLKQFIYSFHVPLFFVVSGFLSDYLHGGERKLRFKSLLVPYAIWTVISVVAYMMIGRTAAGVFGWKYVLQSFLPIDGFVNWNAPLWFLYALFVVEATVPGIDEIKGASCGRWRDIWGVALFCIAMTVFVSIDTVLDINMFAYRQIFLGAAFYMAGACLHRFRVMNFLERKMQYLILIALIGCSAAYFNGKISIYAWHVGRLHLLFLSGLLLSIVVMLVAYRNAKRFVGWDFLKILSNRRVIIAILCTHFAFVYCYGRLGTSHGITMATLAATGVITAYYLVFQLSRIFKLNRKDDNNSCIS